MAESWIKMIHPDLEGSVTEVTESSFNSVWSGKGWVRYDGAVAQPYETTPEPLAAPEEKTPASDDDDEE